MLDLWGMGIIPLLASLPGPLRLRGVAPNRVLSMSQIEVFDICTVYLCQTELFEIELFYI